MGANYTGRFAPSPTGPLHAGSLVAALASWLDARAHGGQWLVRIEDTDTPRCVPGADRTILAQLAACGLQPDAPPLYQSQRNAAYSEALGRLIASSQAYPCACTRQDIAQALAAAGRPKTAAGELVYPGICRHGLQGRAARAWRFKVPDLASNHALAAPLSGPLAIKNIADKTQDSGAHGLVTWHDRRLGAQAQDVYAEVGDFVLRRADGFWAYQLAVVVDDAAQGITHIVRGQDLADNTARQIMLQRALGYSQPAYWHTPLVLAADGDKLSKQHGAPPLDVADAGRALAALQAAGAHLSLRPGHTCVQDWLASAVAQWQAQSDALARQATA